VAALAELKAVGCSRIRTGSICREREHETAAALRHALGP
jgi:hypothetical protein